MLFRRCCETMSIAETLFKMDPELEEETIRLLNSVSLFLDEDAPKCGALRIQEMLTQKYNALVLQGELNMENVRDLRTRAESFLDTSNLPLVLDVNGIEFVDSTGLGAIINLVFEARRRGKKLFILRPSLMLQVLLDQCMRTI